MAKKKKIDWKERLNECYSEVCGKLCSGGCCVQDTLESNALNELEKGLETEPGFKTGFLERLADRLGELENKIIDLNGESLKDKITGEQKTEQKIIHSVKNYIETINPEAFDTDIFKQVFDFIYDYNRTEKRGISGNRCVLSSSKYGCIAGEYRPKICKEYHCEKMFKDEIPLENNALILGHIKDISKNDLTDLIKREADSGRGIRQKIIIGASKSYTKKITKIAVTNESKIQTIDKKVGSEILEIAENINPYYSNKTPEIGICFIKNIDIKAIENDKGMRYATGKKNIAIPLCSIEIYKIK